MQAGATAESMHAHTSETFAAAAAAAAGLPIPLDPPTAAAAAAVDSFPCSLQPAPQLTIQLLSWDGGPRPMPVQDGFQQYDMRFKTIRVLCSGIRSRSSAHAGALLGSVLYSDTFLEVGFFLVGRFRV